MNNRDEKKQQKSAINNTPPQVRSDSLPNRIASLPTDLHHHTLTFLRFDSVSAFHRCAHSTVNIIGQIRSLHFSQIPRPPVKPDVDEIVTTSASVPNVREFPLSSLSSLTHSTLMRHLDHLVVVNTEGRPLSQMGASAVRAIFEAYQTHFAFFAPRVDQTMPNANANTNVNVRSLPYLRSLTLDIYVSPYLNWRLPSQLRNLTLTLQVTQRMTDLCFSQVAADSNCDDDSSSSPPRVHSNYYLNFFECLANLSQLEALTLTWWDPTLGFSVDSKSSSNNSGTAKFAAPSIQQLTKFQRLRSLTLHGDNLLSEATLVANLLPHLTVLLMPDARQENLIALSLTPVAKRIEQLHLAGDEMKYLASLHLARFSSLTQLELPCDYVDEDYNFLSAMPQLSTILMRFGKSYSGVLPSPEIMYQMTHLTHLTLEWIDNQTPSYIRLLEMLCECVHLTHLSVCLNYRNETMNETRLNQLLLSLPGLQRVTFTANKYTSPFFVYPPCVIVDAPEMTNAERMRREYEFDQRMRLLGERSSLSSSHSHSLRSLTLNSRFYLNRDQCHVSSLLNCLPLLESFHFLGLHHQDQQRNEKYFSTKKKGEFLSCPSLTYLRLGTTHNYSTINWNGLSSSTAFPRLQHLVLDGISDAEKERLKNVLPRMLKSIATICQKKHA